MSQRLDNDEVHCDFCAIARGEDLSVEVVGEADNWIAFFPTNPATPGHTLIIPRKHVVDLWEVEFELAAELMMVVVIVGRAIEVSLKPEGMNLISSAGTIAEQTVFHLHLHVVPRWHRDDFGRIWPIEGKSFQKSNLENIADRIREAFREERM
jgi:histidine triad (HIT) family protein